MSEKNGLIFFGQTCFIRWDISTNSNELKPIICLVVSALYYCATGFRWKMANFLDNSLQDWIFDDCGKNWKRKQVELPRKFIFENVLKENEWMWESFNLFLAPLKEAWTTFSMNNTNMIGIRKTTRFQYTIQFFPIYSQFKHDSLSAFVFFGL